MAPSCSRLVVLVAAPAMLIAGCGSSGPSPAETERPVATAAPSASQAVPEATPSAEATTAVPPPPSGSTVGAHNPAPYVEGTPYTQTLDPGDFVSGVDNPYLPWVVGTRFVYRGGGERIVVTVLPETRTILGIDATVVHDQVFEDGALTEDTFDWYAQDSAGNVWYLGEATEELEHGVSVNTEGSWEAGVDGAVAGIVMLADPQVGDAYRQEYLAGEAEDTAEVVDLGTTLDVLGAAISDTVTIEEWTPLEPAIREDKVYAAGIGVVEERTVQGGKGVVRLIELTPGS